MQPLLCVFFRSLTKRLHSWKIGGTAEVTWQVLNNHGGGYSYRLCPADEPLSEKCFMQHPLDFVETEQAVVDRNGKLTKVQNPVFVSEGTTPPGSQWAVRAASPARIH